MSILPCLKRMLTSRLGNVGIIFALASPLVIGSAALSVETSYWYYKQHQLQAAADNAAYAASLENRNGSSQTVINAAALNVASQNSFSLSQGGITVGTPTTGAYANNTAAVQVALTQTAPRFFTQLFSSSPVIITANATAVYSNATDACILALDRAAANAAYFSGSSSLTLNGCVVMSDSDAASGVYVWGAASLTATCVVSAGGVQQKTGSITDTGCAAPMTDVPPAPDPYKNVPYIAGTGPCLPQPSGSNITIPSGHYCSLDFTNCTCTLQAGGQFEVDNGVVSHGNGNVTGDGVTIFVNGANNVSIDANTTLNLSAPTSGTYSGILFYGNPNVPVSAGSINKFNGTASSVTTGAYYFPTQNVTYLGNYAGANGCTQIVADTVSFSGNTGFGVNCTGTGVNPIPVLAAVKLVG